MARPYTRVVGGTSTYSKAARGLPDYPTRAKMGRGAWIDTDKGAMLDFTAGLGAIFLGYGAESEAVRAQADMLTAAALPTRLEEDTAKLLCKMTGWQQVRFCKNGSYATEAAVRLARFVTGRELVLTNSYHGSHSDLVCATDGKAGGVMDSCAEKVWPCLAPADMLNKIVGLHDEVACILVEPMTPAQPKWPWVSIIRAAHKAGALVIFDEVITGFRMHPGPALAPPRPRPDLACYGKAITNGMPLAALAGPRKLMHHLEQDVFMSGTAAGECLSLAACKDTLKQMQALGEAGYAGVRNRGRVLGTALTGLVRGYPTRWQLIPRSELDQLRSVLARRGVLVGNDFFVMAAHTGEDIKQACQVIAEARKEVGI